MILRITYFRRQFSLFSIQSSVYKLSFSLTLKICLFLPQVYSNYLNIWYGLAGGGCSAFCYFHIKIRINICSLKTLVKVKGWGIIKARLTLLFVLAYLSNDTNLAADGLTLQYHTIHLIHPNLLRLSSQMQINLKCLTNVKIC